MEAALTNACSHPHLLSLLAPGLLWGLPGVRVKQVLGVLRTRAVSGAAGRLHACVRVRVRVHEMSCQAPALCLGCGHQACSAAVHVGTHAHVQTLTYLLLLGVPAGGMAA